MDNITVIVLSHKQIDLVSETLKEYEAIMGAKINQEKNLWDCFSAPGEAGSCHPKVSPSMGHWTNRLLGAWFNPDIQMEKNWGEVMSGETTLTQQWAQRKLS